MKVPLSRRRQISRWIALLACIFLSSDLLAAGDPSVDFRTLQTTHFRIHFDPRNRDFAHRLALLAEVAYGQLVAFLGETVDGPVDVVVVDTVDTANGSASTMPYDLIRVYAMAPEADSTLADSDDWLRGLFLHELTHILHINDVSGIPAAINLVFGKTFNPNHILPRWYLEGLAIYDETYFTEGGRLRNNAYRMYLRMDALSGRFRDPENLSGFPIQWPAGTGWYLYGSDFMDWVSRTYGAEKWVEFNQVIGGAISPLSVNHTSREIFGADILQLWGEYSAAAHGEFIAEAVAVTAAGETEVIELTDSGHLNGYPRCAGPTTIAYLRDDGHSSKRVVLQQSTNGETKSVLDVFGNGTFDWSPDGRFMVFTQTARHDHFYTFNDLYRYDLYSRSIERLTEGERAREPAISPNGRQVAFVAPNHRGGADLRELDLETGRITTLIESRDHRLVSMPDYSPDGEMIALSMWERDWGRDLFLWHRASGELDRLTQDRAGDRSPSFTPDGRSLLFASDRSGIYNIYRFDLERREISQLTNVIGGVFTPQQCAPNGPVFVRTYNPEGYDMGMVEVSSERTAAPSYGREEIDYPELAMAEVLVREEGYNPFVTLYPRSWSPMVSQTGESLTLGASVAGSDPLLHHMYTGDVTYNVDSEQVSWAFRYSYTRLPFDIHLFLSRSEYTNRGSLLAETRNIPYREEAFAGGLTLVLPLADERSRHSIYLGYTLQDVNPADIPEIHPDPGDVQPQFPEFGRFDSFSVGWTWGNSKGFAYSVSAEEGTQLSLHLGFSSPAMGADFDRVQLGWGLRQYVSIPWLDGHAIALLLTGGIGRASTDRRTLFGVGGFPDQDLLLAIIENTPIGAGFLRGYPSNVQVGSQYHVLNLEYRLPLFNLDIGAYTLPFFLERLYFATFMDCGTAVDSLEGLESLLVGVGAELRLKSWIGFVAPADFRLGYARGLMDEGANQFYVLYGGTF